MHVHVPCARVYCMYMCECRAGAQSGTRVPFPATPRRCAQTQRRSPARCWLFAGTLLDSQATPTIAARGRAFPGPPQAAPELFSPKPPVHFGPKLPVWLPKSGPTDGRFLSLDATRQAALPGEAGTRAFRSMTK